MGRARLLPGTSSGGSTNGAPRFLEDSPLLLPQGLDGTRAPGGAQERPGGQAQGQTVGGPTPVPKTLPQASPRGPKATPRRGPEGVPGRSLALPGGPKQGE